jgi:hypothetical protein
MNPFTELRFTPAVATMRAGLEPYRAWVESVIGCPLTQAIIFELEVPFGQFAAETILAGVPLDRQCLAGAAALRPLVERMALPPATSPRIMLEPSRNRHAASATPEPGWDPHWKDTPVAVWFAGLTHAVVACAIPYVSYSGGLESKFAQWVLVNPAETVPALERLRSVFIDSQPMVHVLGGSDIALPEDAYNWDRVVLDPAAAQLVRDDFESFLKREDWFRRHGLPFRRGYLLYGPPGNGKTTAARVMASHPAVSAHALDFSNTDLNNDALSCVFERAAQMAPAVVIFEDLDRIYGGVASRENNLTKITLQHLLNCLDGLGSQDGVVVVATANDPTALDPAILKRPGRFDRVVPFKPPSVELRHEYLRRLGHGTLDDTALAEAALQCDGFSFAQVREGYILAGQFAYQRGSETIGAADLLRGEACVRGDGAALGSRINGRAVGFEAAA